MCRLVRPQNLENRAKLIEFLADLNKVFDSPEWQEKISDLPVHVAQRVQEWKDYKARLKAEEIDYFETKVVADEDLGNYGNDLSSTHVWKAHVRSVCESELAIIEAGPLKSFFVAKKNMIIDGPAAFPFAGEVRISGWVPKKLVELDIRRQFHLAPPFRKDVRIDRDFTPEEILTTLVAAHDIVGEFTLLVPDESMLQQLFAPFSDWFKRWQEEASDAWVPQLSHHLTQLQPSAAVRDPEYKKETALKTAESLTSIDEVTGEQPPVGNDSGAGGGGGGGDSTDGVERLTAAPKKAWASWKIAESNHAEQPTDRKAYDWLEQQSDDFYVDDLVDYELPTFDTWDRYVRLARKSLGENKNQPRGGRANSSGSVVRAEEL